MRLVLPVTFGLLLAVAGCGKKAADTPPANKPGASVSGLYAMELSEEERKELGPNEPLPKLTFAADGTWKMLGDTADLPSGTYKVSGDRLTITTGEPGEPPKEFKIEEGGKRLVEEGEEPITFVRTEPKP